MTDKDLANKRAYFGALDLLDLSDDECGFPDDSLIKITRALVESTETPPRPPRLTRKHSSFLGPTPRELQREQQAEFERHAAKRRAISRDVGRTSPGPQVEVPSSFPAPTPSEQRNCAVSTNPEKTAGRKRRVVRSACPDEPPFYKRVGDVPRALGNAKKANPVDIKLEPEHKQWLKGKIVYFYPNDDISAARRMRIHKVIQLGAAWVKKWRSDVTHVMVEDNVIPYGRLLKHLNMVSLPINVTLVKYEPYVPECIHFGRLMQPTASRYLVKNAPRPNSPDIPSSSPVEPPQESPKIKASWREIQARDSQETETASVLDRSSPPASITTAVDVVKDSFVQSIDHETVTSSLDSYGDALSEAIKQTKSILHLPLDEWDSETGRLSSLLEDSLSDDETRPSPRGSTPYHPETESPPKFDQSKFQCMQPNTGASSSNPNARTIEILDQMACYYDQMQDQWRTLSYRRAVATLRKQNRKITTRDQAAALPNIGPRLADKIEEIMLTNRLRRLDTTRADPTDQTLRLFTGIYGVGLVQATKWIQAGHRTLADLSARAALSPSQRIGIARHADFAARIPRAEVAAHAEVVRAALRALDPLFRVTVTGSYRRGARASGDVDLLLTKPGAGLRAMCAVVFDALLPRLFASGYAKARLAGARDGGGERAGGGGGGGSAGEGSKWHGACSLAGTGVWRRVDVLVVPEEEEGAALLYFTGNDVFNRSMRLLASRKGMRLNQRGLYRDVMRGKGRERITQGTLVEGRSERRIFEALGVPWREPRERVC